MQGQNHNQPRRNHRRDRSAHDPIAHRERIHEQRHQDKLQKIVLCAHFGFAGCKVQVLCGYKERSEKTVEAQHLEGGDGGEPFGAVRTLSRNPMRWQIFPMMGEFTLHDFRSFQFS